VKEEPSKFKQFIERVREDKNSSSNKQLWKIRLLFLAPFIIAAAVFLLLSLK
jgi:hypothetical protein